MKFWNLSAVVCCFFADALVGQHLHREHRAGYTAIARNNTTIICWRGKPIFTGKAASVTISPNHQSVAWVVNQLAGYYKVDGQHDPVYAGTLYTAHAGKRVIEIQRLKESRGFEINTEQDPDVGLVYHPEHFQWDHTSRYLYFTTQPWMTRCMLWQLKPESNAPRAIVPTWDYRLLPQKNGEDYVEAYETNYAPEPVCRDWKTTYIYTPTEMAAEKYIESKHKSQFSKDWAKNS